MRTTQQTRERLEAAASANGRSLAQEVEARLERSFAHERRIGGEALGGVANMLIGAFERGGQLGAAACGHPEWTAREWVADPFCYRAAAYAVGQALGLPLPTSAAMADPGAVHDLLTGMIASGVPIKVTKGDDK